ncbi:MAG TPA: phage holin family protein [Gemmatimonadaceae bacterium]|nr:phage holin family protein [Gemmatimonadaceae bacterium]
MTAPRQPDTHTIDPDVGIPDLIRRLTDDSKRLVKDEVRLAKLEVSENVHAGARGALWLGLAFGIGVVGLVGFTIFAATLIGRLAAGHMWVGALVVGVLELVAAMVLIRRGLAAYRGPSYTLEETRESLKDATAWVAHPRAD